VCVCMCVRAITFELTFDLGTPCPENKSSAIAEMGDRLATTGIGRKRGGAAVEGWVPTGSQSNRMWPGPRPPYLFTKWHLDPSNL